MKTKEKPATIPCKLEVVLKVTALPSLVRTVKNGWKQFIINGDGQRIRVKVRPKAWRKLYQVSQQQHTWTALIKGSMGNSLHNGFEILNPSVQIFKLAHGRDMLPNPPVLNEN
ncbi:MAG: hypothetical protein R3E08_01785 [Thiotrichaceae bacterium]